MVPGRRTRGGRQPNYVDKRPSFLRGQPATRLAAIATLGASALVLLVAAVVGALFLGIIAWLALSISLGLAWSTRQVQMPSAFSDRNSAARARLEFLLKVVAGPVPIAAVTLSFVVYGTPNDHGTVIPVVLALVALAAQAGIAQGVIAATAASIADVIISGSFVTPATVATGLSAFVIAITVSTFVRRALYSHRAVEIANQRLRRLSLRDSLTGLLDRRGFEHGLRVELARQARRPAPMAIIVLDFDNFTSTNAQLGRSAGDSVLQLFADSVEKYSRESDAVGRIDGDEFALVLPLTERSGAAFVAERIISSFLRDCPALTHNTKVSITYGVATHPEDGDSPESLLASADSDRARRRGVVPPTA